MNRSIKIGCIGPSDSISVITSVIESYYSDVVFNIYTSEKVSDAGKDLDKCQNENDGILFTGIAIQEQALSTGKVFLPYEHIPRSGYSLIRSFLQMNRSKKKINRVSIDVVDMDVINTVSDEMGIKFEKIIHLPFDPEKPENEYEEEHMKFYENGLTDAMASGFGAVFESLKSKGYPSFRLYPSQFEIRENMDRLLGRISAKTLKSAGIAIQLINLASIKKNSIHQYDDLKKQGQFYLELLEYVQSLQGSLFRMGKEFVIYATRGGVESIENMAKFCRLLDWGKLKNIRIASGIGIGNTAFEAEKSAGKALSNALEMNSSAFFIVHDEKLRGPIASEFELTYPIIVSETEDLKKAAKIGLNPGYLTKIKALITKTGKSVFDAHDLAACIGISERSARRILKKFVDSGYGEISALETDGRAGRPKKLIKLKI